MVEDREWKWQKAWKENHLFEPIKNSSKEKFFLTVAYPYPTGPLHMGHGRTYVVGDVLARFSRVKGKNVFWPMGFHVTGTPVLAVSDAIARNDPDKIDLYKQYVSIYEKNPKRINEIVRSFSNPKNVADFFAGYW